MQTDLYQTKCHQKRVFTDHLPCDLPLARRVCREPWPGLTSCCFRESLKPRTSADLGTRVNMQSGVKTWRGPFASQIMNGSFYILQKPNSKCWNLKLSLSRLRVQHQEVMQGFILIKCWCWHAPSCFLEIASSWSFDLCSLLLSTTTPFLGSSTNSEPPTNHLRGCSQTLPMDIFSTVRLFYLR